VYQVHKSSSMHSLTEFTNSLHVAT